jgi:DisA bacterial checkpoint controller nucleotide-binding
MTHRLQSYLGYSYPAQLAELIKKVWPREAIATLPDDAELRLVLDVAYHASLLREEQRQVTFRVILIPPEDLPDDGGPPTGFSPILLDRPRAFNEQEVRRIATAAEFFRSLIGVSSDPEGRLNIWGIVVSGTRWVNAVDGGRYAGASLPARLVVHALGPGRLTLFRGQKRIAALSGGEMEAHAFDLFQSKWLPQAFAAGRAQIMEQMYGTTQEKSVPLGGDFLKMMSQNVLRRTLSVVRNAKHGGTLIFIEPDEEDLHIREHGSIRFKYRVAPGDTRSHYQKALSLALRRLFQIAEEKKLSSAGWREYQTVADLELGNMDEALFEFAHFLADLMSIDGALILTKRFELVGFGAELRTDSPALVSVRRALDLEATIWANESLDDGGTRHRAVYRFCDRYVDCLAIVISQDGSVRFVKKHNEIVTYWNQLSW